MFLTMLVEVFCDENDQVFIDTQNVSFYKSENEAITEYHRLAKLAAEKAGNGWWYFPVKREAFIND